MKLTTGFVWVLLCGCTSALYLHDNGAKYSEHSLVMHHINKRRISYFEKFDEKLLDEFSTKTTAWKPPPPDIKSLQISSQIENRYANTLITSRVTNPANVSQEVTFTVIIPETAFISAFAMEIQGKIYKAYVKEKEEAKREYDNAVSAGHAAAHVQQSARDSERFSVSVNIEAESKVTFNLTYEELLQREQGVYRHVINLNPGQIVPEMKIDVHIKELKKLIGVRANDIKSANEIDDDIKENPKAQVEFINPNEAKIHFEADDEEQKRLEKLKKAGENSKGVSGQFVIEYDVLRDSQGGEIIVNDGYFVHFFAPTDLPPLRKHVLFVLDVSGSMSGRKIDQLKEAMMTILDQLHPHDVFNIIEFSYSVTVRNLDAEVDSAVYQPPPFDYSFSYDSITEINPKPENTQPFPANSTYIEKAKTIVKRMTANGGTNIYDALKMALKIAKRGVFPDSRIGVAKQDNEPETKAQAEVGGHDSSQTPQPIIIFLTDGEPTVGETRLHKIQAAVNELNGPEKATIFSLAFGEGADFKFLKKLSLANNGFARHIYEAADATEQLRKFYTMISSPLLAEVKYVYPPDQIDTQSVTKRIFHNLFKGSEIVIAGKTLGDIKNFEIDAISLDGPVRFVPSLPGNATENRKLGSLERLWAYLNVQRLLEEQEIMEATRPQISGNPDPLSTADNSTKAAKREPKEEALKIALKYSFVCPLTSLVVVKPEGKSDHNTESASPGMEDGPDSPYAMPFRKHHFQGYGGPVIHKTLSMMMGPPSFSSMPGFGYGRMASSSRTSQMAMALPPPYISPMYQQNHLMMMRPPSFSSLPGLAGRPPPPSPSYSGAFFAPNVAPVLLAATESSSPVFDRVDPMVEEEDVVEMAPTTESEVQTTPVDGTTAAFDNLSPGLDWLENIREGDNVVLNTTNGLKTLSLKVPSAESYGNISCSANGTNGLCQPLKMCSAELAINNVEEYVDKYLCILPGDHAGACCPIKEVPEAVTEPTATQSTAELLEGTTETLLEKSGAVESTSQLSITETTNTESPTTHKSD